MVLTWQQVPSPQKRVLADLIGEKPFGKGVKHLESAGMAYKPSLAPQDEDERMCQKDCIPDRHMGTWSCQLVFWRGSVPFQWPRFLSPQLNSQELRVFPFTPNFL